MLAPLKGGNWEPQTGNNKNILVGIFLTYSKYVLGVPCFEVPKKVPLSFPATLQELLEARSDYSQGVGVSLEWSELTSSETVEITGRLWRGGFLERVPAPNSKSVKITLWHSVNSG